MITSMMNKKRGLTDIVSCLAMESTGCQTASLKIWSKIKTPPGGPINRQEVPDQLNNGIDQAIIFKPKALYDISRIF